MKKPITEFWETYRKQVIPDNAGTVQIQETKRAFYAGATALFDTIHRIAKENPGDEPTEKEIAVLDSVEDDLVSYFNSISKN